MREARSRNVLTGTTSKLNHEAEVGARVRGDASRNLSNSSIKEGTIASRRILPSDEKRRKGLAPALWARLALITRCSYIHMYSWRRHVDIDERERVSLVRPLKGLDGVFTALQRRMAAGEGCSPSSSLPLTSSCRICTCVCVCVCACTCVCRAALRVDTSNTIGCRSSYP